MPRCESRAHATIRRVLQIVPYHRASLAQPMNATGPLLLVSLVLGVAGTGKLMAPAQALTAWRLLGLPGDLAVIKVLGGFELLVAIGASVAGSMIAVYMMGTLYLAFAIAVWRLLALGHREVSCGCFGIASAPVSVVHVTINTVCAGAAFCGAVLGVPDIRALALDHGVIHAGFVALSAGMGAYATLILLTHFPIAAPQQHQSPDTRN